MICFKELPMTALAWNQNLKSSIKDYELFVVKHLQYETASDEVRRFVETTSHIGNVSLVTATPNATAS
jgi:hypothetical protein